MQTTRTNLEIAKEIIEKNIYAADAGIFNTRNWTGDKMTTIYENKEGLVIDICYQHGYFEVFGLSEEEFKELKDYYREIN